MEELKESLKNVIKDLYGLDFDPELTPSPESIDADYSSNAPLKLAKLLKKPPMEIASDLLERLLKDGKISSFESVSGFGEPKMYIPDDTEEVVPEGQSSPDVQRMTFSGSESTNKRRYLPSVKVSMPGFLNFTLSNDFLSQCLDAFSGNFKSNEFEGKTVICEFSDPNPFKVLHVGHLYTSIVGDSIGKLFEYAGAKVIRANFGGDVGLHVAKTIYALKNKPIEELTIDDISKSYVEGTAAYDNDETAREEITKLNKEIYRINKNDEHGNPLADLYWRGRELSYAYFDDFYAKIGVKFDKYYPESTVADLGLETVKRELNNGVYEESDGAIIFNGEKFGLHTRVFINREGVPTYEAKDVGLIFKKNEDYHFDKSVVITGSEQLEYMKVVLKSIEQYAKDLVEKTSHLTHGLVKLPGNIKMSSRKGNFLKAIDVLNMIHDELKEEYNSEDEKIALAATKYAFLKYKMGGDIVFDPQESVKMTGNSGPYLLYSAVRAKKILSRAFATDEGQETVSREPYEASEVTEPRNDGREGTRSKDLHPSERNLMKKLLEYKGVLDEAVSEMAPHKVAGYLYDLAQSFSRFYESCPVIGCEYEEQRKKLVKAYLETMTHGLNILGIEIPEEM